MVRYSIPTRTDVESTVRRLTTYQLRRVFYERLENPHWVKPLDELGVFVNPPEPEATSDGYIREEFWPEVSYLISVCKDVPTQVVDVLLTLEATSSSWVRRAAFVIGSQVPAEEAVRLKPLFKAWTQSGGFGWRTDPRDLVSFTINLLDGGQRKYGVSFANLLFRPQEAQGDSRDPVVELKTHWYVEELPRLVQALGDDALKTVLPWLVEYERSRKAFTTDFDLSGFTRSLIGQQDNAGQSVEDGLIDAVAKCAIDGFTINASATWLLFKSNPILITERIAMYSLAGVLESATSTKAPPLVAIGNEMLERPKCRDEGARLELIALARALAERSEKQTLEQIIKEGHFTEADRRRIRTNMAADGKTTDDIESSLARWDDHWRHQVLSGVGRELLSPSLIFELDRLDVANGVLEDPLRPSVQITSWVGPNSPVEQEEMARMSPHELLIHLGSWHMSGNRVGPGPSHEGQARALTAVLTANPHALGELGGLVDRLRPTYVRAAIEGWNAGFKAGLDLDWPAVMRTLTDVVRHARASRFPVEGGQFDDDADFGAAKQAAVSFLEQLSKPTRAERMNPKRLSTVAGLIVEVSVDELAWLDYVGSDATDSGIDPLTISLNWQWPIMLRALINLISHGRETTWYQESTAALQRELDREDPRGASRAVLGEGLGKLYSNAFEWLNEHHTAYFGSEDSMQKEQQIALTTAIAMHYYHPDLYQILSGPMLAALRCENEVAVGWGTRLTPREQIGQWVVQAIIRGDSTKADKLCQGFYEIASSDVRGSAIGNIAWSFLHANFVDDEIRDRLGALWDERVHHVELNIGDKAELKDFYWFIRCGKFAADWWLPRLEHALELDSGLDTHGMIGEQLAEAASVDPAIALVTLTRLLEQEDTATRDNWELRREALAPVIAAAMKSGDSTLERDAYDLMQAMGARGETDLDRRVAELREDFES